MQTHRRAVGPLHTCIEALHRAMEGVVAFHVTRAVEEVGLVMSRQSP